MNEKKMGDDPKTRTEIGQENKCETIRKTKNEENPFLAVLL